MVDQSSETPAAPLWFEVVVNGSSYYYKTLEEAELAKTAFNNANEDVDSEIYSDSCLPSGSYFIGDPSLALTDWESGKGTKYPLKNGVYLLGESTYFAIYEARKGPGTYYDEEGIPFFTQSGFLAFLPIYDADSDLDGVLDLDACEALEIADKAQIYEFQEPADTRIDRQGLGCIDYGDFPFIMTGDEL